MRKLKNILSFVLAGTMMFSSVSPAYATGTTDTIIGESSVLAVESEVPETNPTGVPGNTNDNSINDDNSTNIISSSSNEVDESIDIAEEPVYKCGLEEHKHDKACLKTLQIKEGDKTYTTTLLACGRTEHTHSEECLKDQTDVNLTEDEKTTYCGHEEHTHSFSCLEKGDLICENTDKDHEHTDECYEWVVVCGEESHTHSDKCYEKPEENITIEEEKDVPFKQIDAVKDVEPENEPEKQPDEKTDTDKQQNITEDISDESVEKEEINNVDYVSEDNTEAVTAEGMYAEDPVALRTELRTQNGLSDFQAKLASKNLMNMPLLGAGEEEGNNENEENEPPRQGDGSNIESIAAKWITADTVDNNDPALLYVKPSGTETQEVRMQINYALSGEHNYEPGDITITVPSYIIHRRGGAPYGTMIIPFPEEPSRKGDFNWTLIDGNYVLTNTKRMSAATKGYIQFAVTELSPYELVDMEESDPFDAYIEVVTHKGNLIALRSNAITAQFDTEARVTNAGKAVYQSVERVPASSIPESQRVAGEEEYIKVNWYTWAYRTSNTKYYLDIKDTIPVEYDGFIINATEESGLETNQPQTTGTADGRTGYTYFATAYPASQFEPDVEYTFHNNVLYTLTEIDPENGDDPQLVTTAPASAQTTWSYSLPKWVDPTGHFMVVKNGNDDKINYNHTRHLRYQSERSDLHLWSLGSPIHGWYGVYPSALNDMQDGDDINLSYTVNSIGYIMPWTYDPVEPVTELSSRMISNYFRRAVTMTTEDTGVSLSQGGAKLQVGTDYEFVSVEFPEQPWIYKGEPQNINPDGSWAALTAGDGTFKYERDNDASHVPQIRLDIKRGGEWEEWATADWTSGSIAITMKDGTPVTGTVVNVPSDTETFRSVVTLTNAAIDYDLRPVIKLKKTTLMDLLITEGFRKSNTPAMNVWNSANMKAVQTDTGEEIVSLDDDGFDSMRGYTTDVSVVPQKSSRQTISDVDYETRNITIHYSAKVEERSVINDKKTYLQAIEDGRLIAETSGIWRDLLPKGVTPVLSSVKLRSGDTIKNVYALENYKNSGRTLLVVEADLTVYPERYKSGDMYYWEDVPRIEFNALYDFDSLVDYGRRMHNVISFQSGNDFIGTVEHYSGEPDDPTAGNNIASDGAFANAETDADEREKEIRTMTNLDKDFDKPNFVYAGVYTNIDIISAARTSLFKDIMVNNDGDWDDGLYYEDPENNKKTVYTGGTYIYRLRMMSDTETISKDLILYDSLENFYAGDGNDVIDIDAARWQGKLESVDMSQLEDMGCAPILYYSTVENLLLSDETDPDKANTTNVDLSNTSIWTKASDYQGSLADVKAIAVDASKKKDGTDFSLDPMASVAVLLRMRAPSGEAASTYISQTGVWGDSAQAYNNAYLLCTSIDKNTGDADGDNFVRKDYTKLGLEEYKLDVEKQWDDDNNRDGIRPNSVTVHLLQNGNDTGQTATLTAEEPIQTFHHLPYTDPEGVPYQYTFSEDPVNGYTSIINKTDNGALIINAHDPERFTYEGEKRWVDDVEVSESARPDKVTIQLFANGKYVKQIEVGPDENGEWKFAFPNVFRNENGEEIQYTVKEVVPASIYGKMNSYTVSYEGHDVINTYHPHGDLKVIKDVTDTTNVSVNTEFSFTFTFERKNETDGEENVPVFDEFNYDVVDDENTVLRSGTIANNGTINIKGGERIVVHEIPEYVIYNVSEEIPEGFKQASKAGDTGTIYPNKTAEATFINKYAASGQINLSAVKHLDNRKLNKYQFKYDVYDMNGNVIRSASNAAPDNTSLREDETVEYSTAPVRFGAIKYTEKDAGKVFTYAIHERNDSKAGYTYDESGYLVKVSVTDNGDGTLNIVPSYHNACETCMGSGVDYNTNLSIPTGSEIPHAKDKTEVDYTDYVTNLFGSIPSGMIPGDVNDVMSNYEAFLDRVTELGIGYTENGYNDNTGSDFEYLSTISFNGDDDELNTRFVELASVLSGLGFSFDEVAFEQGVGGCKIGFYVGNPESTLGIDYIKIYPKCPTCHGEMTSGNPLEAITFNNEYHAEGSVVLRAWKDLQGRQLQNGEFTFELYDENKNLVDTKTNTEDGSVVFDALNFDEKDIGKTYHYFVKEVTGEDETVNYDQNVYGYQIEVLDNGDGTLSFSQGHATPIFGSLESNPDAFKYAVSLYGIGVDQVATGDVVNSTETYEGTSVETETAGLTFGPALGANYVTSYHSHTPSGTTSGGHEHRCIHDDDWATIIEWNNEDPEVYEQCITEGCTHSVELDLPAGLKNASFDPKYTTGDGPGALYRELMLNDSSYENLRWHPNNNRPGDTGNYGTNYEGWGATRIRAMLNGADALTDTGDGTENGDTYSSSASSDINKSASVYTGDNNLLSAFPVELKSAIGARVTKYDSVYNQKTEQNLKTSYDKLWLLSPNEIWTTAQNTNRYYTHPLEGTQYPYFASKSNMGTSSTISQNGTIAYYRSSNSTNTGSALGWWLRSSRSNRANIALCVLNSGYCDDYNAYSGVGVSPCFSLKAHAELPEPEITGWETEDAEMPVFRNTLKDGELQVEKYVENESAADPGKKFHFKVVLIGDDVPQGEFDYDYNQSQLGTATITYDGNGGIFEQNGDSTDNVVTYKEAIGGNVSALEGEYYQPVKEGHTFAGWYEDTEFTIPFDHEKFTGEDKTVYAKWEINHYSVTFEMNGGTPAIATQDVVWNEKATKPADPTKGKFPFEGWYTDAGLTEEFNFNTPITDDVILYAKWGPITYAHAVITNDGELVLFRSESGYPSGVVQTVTDIKGNTYTGRVYANIETTNTNSTSNSKWYSYRSSIKSARIADGQIIKPINTAYWFNGCSNLTSINLSGLNTGNVTNMSNMFDNCSKLTTIDVSGFDTRNVTSMRRMFFDCSKLTGIDVSGFDTGNVTSMENMFYHCSNLTSLDVSGFDTSNVTDMNGMFKDCSNLTGIDVSGFDTSKVTNMSSMFRNCPGLTNLNISGFDTGNVTDMSFMFYTCSNITSLDVSGFDTSNVTDMRYMFDNCSALTSLDVSGFDTSNVTDMSVMFGVCSKLTSLDVSGFDTSNVTDMRNMFSTCRSLTSLDVSGFDTGNVTNMKYMFSTCRSLTSLDVSGFDTGNVTDMNWMFYDCSSLTNLDVSGFDTSNVTDMGLMFNGCSKLSSVNLGENFSFSGKNITNTSNKALLPTPYGTGYTGKWIKQDGNTGPYTPIELRDNYDGSTMSGVWVWETT